MKPSQKCCVFSLGVTELCKMKYVLVRGTINVCISSNKVKEAEAKVALVCKVEGRRICHFYPLAVLQFETSALVLLTSKSPVSPSL